MTIASFAQDNTVMVGGEAMYPMKNIVENAVNSKLERNYELGQNDIKSKTNEIISLLTDCGTVSVGF